MTETRAHCVYCGVPVTFPLATCKDCADRWWSDENDAAKYRDQKASASPERSASERSEVGASKGGEAPAENAREAAARLGDLTNSKSAAASAALSGMADSYQRGMAAEREWHERVKQALGNPMWDRRNINPNERTLGLEAAGTVAEEEAMAQIREALERHEHERYLGMMATPEDFAREQKQQDAVTYDNVMAKIEELKNKRDPNHRDGHYVYDDEGKFITVDHVKRAAETLRAMKHLSENDDTLLGEPWFTYEQVIQQLGKVVMTEFMAGISTLVKTGLVEVDSRSMKVRLRSARSQADWHADGLGSQGFQARMDLREKIQKQEKRASEREANKKKVDPTPWVYQGASEEALLAVEAMHPRAAKVRVGSTPEGIHVYSVREVADHRPFEVIFDAIGQPVENVQQITWSGVGGANRYGQNVDDAAFTMIKDLLAALITKLERASVGYLCRGCGELDPADMQAGTDWHVVIIMDHDHSSGGHGPNGECLTCPIEVQEQCGPIVKVGGA